MRFLVALALFVLLAGCVSNGDGAGPSPLLDPEQSFKELAEKGESLPDGYYKYEMTMSSEQATEYRPVGSVSFDAEIHKLGERAKKAVQMPGITMTSYEIEGNFFECRTLLDDTSCEQEEFSSFETLTLMSFLDFFRENFDGVSSFSYVGIKQFAGRNCHDFSFGISKEKMNELMQVEEAEEEGFNLPYKDSRMKYNACLDSEHGFLVSYKLELFEADEQGQENKTIEMGLELQEYDPAKVTEDDLRFPIDALD